MFLVNWKLDIITHANKEHECNIILTFKQKKNDGEMPYILRVGTLCGDKLNVTELPLDYTITLANEEKFKFIGSTKISIIQLHTEGVNLLWNIK